MKIEMIKLRGGGLIPADDRNQDIMKRFKNGDLYTIEIKQQRNYEFHKNVFAFMNFCFDHWVDDNNYRTEQASFDVFRANLIVLAGYKTAFYKIDGSVRVEAKSISYAKMQQSDFEELYKALIQAAMNTIFKNCDESYYDRLIGFF